MVDDFTYTFSIAVLRVKLKTCKVKHTEKGAGEDRLRRRESKSWAPQDLCLATPSPFPPSEAGNGCGFESLITVQLDTLGRAVQQGLCSTALGACWALVPVCPGEQ